MMRKNHYNFLFMMAMAVAVLVNSPVVDAASTIGRAAAAPKPPAPPPPSAPKPPAPPPSSTKWAGTPAATAAAPRGLVQPSPPQTAAPPRPVAATATPPAAQTSTRELEKTPSTKGLTIGQSFATGVAGGLVGSVVGNAISNSGNSTPRPPVSTVVQGPDGAAAPVVIQQAAAPQPQPQIIVQQRPEEHAGAPFFVTLLWVAVLSVLFYFVFRALKIYIHNKRDQSSVGPEEGISSWLAGRSTNLVLNAKTTAAPFSLEGFFLDLHSAFALRDESSLRAMVHGPLLDTLLKSMYEQPTGPNNKPHDIRITETRAYQSSRLDSRLPFSSERIAVHYIGEDRTENEPVSEFWEFEVVDGAWKLVSVQQVE